MRRFIPLLSVLLLLSKPAFSDHLMGGEFSYKCLGGSNYEVSLIIYRNCNSTNNNLDIESFITVFDKNTGGFISTFTIPQLSSTRIPLPPSTPCFQAPPVCVDKLLYRGNATLNVPPNGIRLVYQRCCRNPGISNVPNAGSFGSTYELTIPPASTAACNSSPSFDNTAPNFICVNQESIFDFSATDPDGDVLTYELCAPKQGADLTDPAPTQASPPPYPTIPYGLGFSFNSPLGSGAPITINSTTGQLKVTANTVGLYIVGVCVNEFRNNVLIGQTIRDFQFNVTDCKIPEAKPAAILDPGSIGKINDSTYVFCSSKTIDFQNLTTGTVLNQLWDFGITGRTDDTSDLKNPTFTYTDTGVYKITLITNRGTDCADTGRMYIKLNPKVTPDFVMSQNNVCAGVKVTLTDASFSELNDINQWRWKVGADSIFTQNTSASITTPGTYPIALKVVTLRGCLGTISKPLTIAPGPIADFSLKQVCYGIRALYTNLTTISGGTVSNYYWNLGNGVIDSVNVNPTTTYPVNGNYAVQLIAVSNNGCRDTVVKNISIVDSLKPDFTFPVNNCQLSAVQFSNTSTGNFTGYTWHFGDAANSTSTVPSPTFTYPLDGIFPVKLVVNHAICGKDSIQKNITIKQKPTVSLPSSVSFCNGATTTLSVPNTFDSIRWNTNQTTSSISVNGNINPIRVDVFKNGCSAFASTSLQLKPKPNADFSLRQVCYGIKALYTNQSTIPSGSIPKLYWDFGNGGIDSVNVNPVTAYPNNNNYNVQLIAVSDFGCRDTVIKNISIIDSLKPNFTFPGSNCQLSPVQFTNASTGNYTGFNWFFRDAANSTSTAVNPSFSYPLDGTFPVKLIVNHAICGKDSIVKNIIIKSKPAVSLPANLALCNGSVTVLSVPNQYDSLRWNTNETTNSITLNGSKNPVSISVFKNGCTNVATTALIIKPKPIADFATDKYCSNKPTAFINTSVVAAPDSIVLHNWNINGGAFAAQQKEPVFNLNQITNYDVQLIVITNAGCKDTFNRVLSLRDTFIPDMIIPASVCFRNPAQFFDNSKGDNISYTWLFGDGKNSTVKDPLHTYTTEGNFSIRLTVQNKNCGTDSVTKNFAVLPLPRITLDDSIIMCPGELRSVVAGGAFDSVFWSNGTTVNPTTIDGTESPVTFTGFKSGCKSSDSVRIVLNCDIYIPTAFSPNNDGYNDVFNFIPVNVASFMLRIYNRWGELVFETTDLSKSWDGTYKGTPCPVDSYMYIADGIKRDNKPFSVKGAFTLLR